MLITARVVLVALIAIATLVNWVSLAAAHPADSKVGIFEAHGDIGTVLHSGSARFDNTADIYTITASGDNMWFAKDAFHFAWKKATGDLSLTADVSFVGKGKDPHRKACLMIRQSLDADAAYVDVALHGDGLTSLQFRQTKGSNTHEVQANVSSVTRLRLEKRGKYALMYLGGKDETAQFSGAAVRVTLEEPFYVGIGVCAHNKDLTETAVFSTVELTAPGQLEKKSPIVYS